MEKSNETSKSPNGHTEGKKEIEMPINEQFAESIGILIEEKGLELEERRLQLQERKFQFEREKYGKVLTGFEALKNMGNKKDK